MKGPIGCLPRYVWDPNISGETEYAAWMNRPDTIGCFVVNSSVTGKFPDDSTINPTIPRGLSFNASNSNSIYSGSALQVDALQALCCIKL